MKALYIKKSKKSLPLEIFNTLLFLGPAMYFLYAYELHVIVLVLLMIYMLLVIAIGAYVIFYLRSGNRITIFDNGIELENKRFFEWTAIESYHIEEETVNYNSLDTGNTYATTRTLHIILKNADLVRVSADQLDKKPNQIIELFDQRRNIR